MAMVGVDCGSLYRRTHSLSRLVWSWVGGRLAPFYINQMNRVDSCNGDMMTVRKHCLRIIITYYYYCISVKLHATVNAARCVCRSAEKEAVIVAVTCASTDFTSASKYRQQGRESQQ